MKRARTALPTEKSCDARSKFSILKLIPVPQGRVFGWKDEFREFVRLQIGRKWYRVSDKVEWSMELKAKVNGGSWLNWGSTFSPQVSP